MLTFRFEGLNYEMFTIALDSLLYIVINYMGE